jgi:hypothetical protein
VNAPRLNRRVAFFAGAALVCLALAPLADAKFRWLPELLAAVYAVLALLVALDSASRHRR